CSQGPIGDRGPPERGSRARAPSLPRRRALRPRRHGSRPEQVVGEPPPHPSHRPADKTPARANRVTPPLPPSYSSPSMSHRVLVAMSGGVDSSVAAARLVRAGWDVVGVTLHLWDYPDDGSVRGRCCAPEDVHDARRVADVLGIPHYAFDRRELFDREVGAPCVQAYLAGTTPS